MGGSYLQPVWDEGSTAQSGGSSMESSCCPLSWSKRDGTVGQTWAWCNMILYCARRKTIFGIQTCNLLKQTPRWFFPPKGQKKMPRRVVDRPYPFLEASHPGYMTNRVRSTWRPAPRRATAARPQRRTKDRGTGWNLHPCPGRSKARSAGWQGRSPRVSGPGHSSGPVQWVSRDCCTANPS